MKILVSHDKGRVIGHCGEIPFDVPVDRRHFWALTIDSTIIMGRRTYDSLPRAPLPGRLNVVVSSRMRNSGVDNLKVVRSCEEAFASYPDAWVVGGESIYEQALASGLVDTILATVIAGEHPGDCHFPSLLEYEWDSSLYLKLPQCEFWSHHLKPHLRKENRPN